MGGAEGAGKSGDTTCPRPLAAPGGEGRGSSTLRGSGSATEGRKFLALGASLRSPAEGSPATSPARGASRRSRHRRWPHPRRPRNLARLGTADSRRAAHRGRRRLRERDRRPGARLHLGPPHHLPRAGNPAPGPHPRSHARRPEAAREGGRPADRRAPCPGGGPGDPRERAAARVRPQAGRGLRRRDACARPAPRRVPLHGERSGRRQGRDLQPGGPPRSLHPEAARRSGRHRRPSGPRRHHHDGEREGLGAPVRVPAGLRPGRPRRVEATGRGGTEGGAGLPAGPLPAGDRDPLAFGRFPGSGAEDPRQRGGGRAEGGAPPREGAALARGAPRPARRPDERGHPALGPGSAGLPPRQGSAPPRRRRALPPARHVGRPALLRAGSPARPRPDARHRAPPPGDDRRRARRGGTSDGSRRRPGRAAIRESSGPSPGRCSTPAGKSWPSRPGTVRRT